jgi:hypothetical protein
MAVIAPFRVVVLPNLTDTEMAASLNGRASNMAAASEIMAAIFIMAATSRNYG